MAPTSTHPSRQQKPLRLWPAIVIVALMGLSAMVSTFVPAGAGLGVFAGLAGGLAILLWWMFFSRAPWLERLSAVGLVAVAAALTQLVIHESIRNGMMGLMFVVFAIPTFGVALVAWAVVSRGLGDAPRRTWMVVAIVLACGAMTLVRTGGISGDGESELHWRWTPTPEQRLLAQAADNPALAPPPAATVASQPEPSPVAGAVEVPGAPSISRPSAEPLPTPSTLPGSSIAPTPAAVAWPGFRGIARDGIVHGVRIATDWSLSPPTELWRRPIGPGWSSFAVEGDLVYTQEQRGEDELVSAYSLRTGDPVWRHRDPVRFWESNGGAGPRATPTLSRGRVYTLGATGLLNALDARDGTLIWSRNAATDHGRTVPDWGIASSPLVVDDRVIVAVAGKLAAYDAATGQPRWSGPEGGGGYSSPHLVTIDGVAQVVLLRGARTTSVAPSDGALLWEHRGDAGVSIVQPGVTADGDVLISPGDAMGGTGMRRLRVVHGPVGAAGGTPGGWTVEERWTSRGLKPYFNDFVVHQGYAYGFDGSILSCIDLNDGARKWKGGRYGHGQMLLLADENVLLVLSEEGDLALVRAAPDQFTELARVPAIDGKTWNHPVLVGDVLLVRNGQEMVAFKLALARRD